MVQPIFNQEITADDRVRFEDGILKIEKKQLRKDMNWFMRLWTRSEYSQKTILKQMKKAHINGKATEVFFKNYQHIEKLAVAQNTKYKDYWCLTLFFKGKQHIELAGHEYNIKYIQNDLMLDREGWWYEDVKFDVRQQAPYAKGFERLECKTPLALLKLIDDKLELTNPGYNNKEILFTLLYSFGLGHVDSFMLAEIRTKKQFLDHIDANKENFKNEILKKCDQYVKLIP